MHQYTTVQKFGVHKKEIILKEINTFIQKEYIEMIKCAHTVVWI